MEILLNRIHARSDSLSSTPIILEQAFESSTNYFVVCGRLVFDMERFAFVGLDGQAFAKSLDLLPLWAQVMLLARNWLRFVAFNDVKFRTRHIGVPSAASTTTSSSATSLTSTHQSQTAADLEKLTIQELRDKVPKFWISQWVKSKKRMNGQTMTLTKKDYMDILQSFQTTEFFPMCNDERLTANDTQDWVYLLSRFCWVNRHMERCSCSMCYATHLRDEDDYSCLQIANKHCVLCVCDMCRCRNHAFVKYLTVPASKDNNNNEAQVNKDSCFICQTKQLTD